MQSASGIKKFGGRLLAVFLIVLAFEVNAQMDTHDYQTEAEAHCLQVGAEKTFPNAQNCGNYCNKSGKMYIVRIETTLNGLQCGDPAFSGVNSYGGHQYLYAGAPPNPCDAVGDKTGYVPQESGDICVDIGGDWCQYTPTTNSGNCDNYSGTVNCWVNLESTGIQCAGPDPDPPPELPDNCIRNESTGDIACDCSVDPNQSFCLDPNIDDHDLPTNCIRNEATGQINCYTNPNDPSNPQNPQKPDPDQNPNPGPIPGDDNGDGVCDVGEACEGDNIGNELLKDIKDLLSGDGLDLGDSASDAAAKNDANFNKKIADMTKGKEGGESEINSGIADAGDDIDEAIQNIFTTGSACPEIKFNLRGAGNYEVDTSYIVGAIRGISSFVMWALCFFAIYLIWFRLVFR